jgi:hypothetical protein
MRIGNYYEVLTDRWNDYSWIWSVMHSWSAEAGIVSGDDTRTRRVRVDFATKEVRAPLRRCRPAAEFGWCHIRARALRRSCG